MKLREQENLKLKNLRTEPLPHVKNAEVTRVPSEDIAAQKMMQDNMQLALDDMHQQLLDDVSRFIDNQVKDIDWMTGPVTLDYLASDFDAKEAAIEVAAALIYNMDDNKVLAADEKSIDAFLKLLTFFVAYGNTNSNISRII